jgi:hypothetical protein
MWSFFKNPDVDEIKRQFASCELTHGLIYVILICIIMHGGLGVFGEHAFG